MMAKPDYFTYVMIAVVPNIPKISVHTYFWADKKTLSKIWILAYKPVTKTNVCMIFIDTQIV